MTTTAITSPTRAAGTTTSSGQLQRAGTAPDGPRLLLPPRPEPRGRPLTVVGQHAAARRTWSVLSPITDQHWPLSPASTADEAPELPDPRQLCGAVVLAAVEALQSTRPLAQLARWVSPEVFESLAQAATPPVPSRGRARAVVRGLRVCRISPTVAEGSVVIHDGPRVRAAAVRLEAHRGSWRVTVLHIG